MADFLWMTMPRTADVDLTAMTLQCLEPYQDEKDVKEDD